MSSTQVQHADESVVVPVAMHDRFMDEESAHDHVAGSWCSYEVNAATSRHVECPLPECRTLSDADTVSRSGGGALGHGVQHGVFSSRVVVCPGCFH